MPIVLDGFIDVPAADIQAVREALPEHIANTRAEEGCLTFQVEPVEDVPGRYRVHEKFVDRAAFDKHQLRVKSSRWGQITRNVVRHYKESEMDVADKR